MLEVRNYQNLLPLVAFSYFEPVLIRVILYGTFGGLVRVLRAIRTRVLVSFARFASLDRICINFS
jgi:hypothetical protein